MIEQAMDGAAMNAGQRSPVLAEQWFSKAHALELPMATRVVPTRAHRCAGASLLEVLVALSLLAASLVGVAAAQLAALRDADAQAGREQATWMAFSIAETMAAPESAAPMLVRSRASIATVLPGARISVTRETGDIGTVIVHWPRPLGTQVRAQSPNAGPCGFASDNERDHCIAQPFAVGGA